MLCTVLFVVAYFAFEVGDEPTVFAGLGASTVGLGLTLGLALLFIGIGIIQWARKLMSDHEIFEARHEAASSPEDRAETLAILAQGLEESGLARRPLIRNTMLGAMGLVGVPLIVGLRDLGPLPGDKLYHTIWEKGMRVVRDVMGTPVHVSDLVIGDLMNAEPEALFPTEENGYHEIEGVELQIGKAKGAVILHRMEPNEITPSEGRENWSEQGIVVLLQDLHARRLPDLAQRAAEPPPAVPLPPVDLRPRRQRPGDLRAGGPRPAPAADRRRRRGLPGGLE